VAGRVRNALSDGELEEASDAVEVGVHPRNLGERLGIDGALERNPDEALVCCARASSRLR
jgi:hypothetical protein